jgi:hypothetical protein
MTSSPLDALVARLESVEALDDPGRTAGRKVRRLIPDGAPKDVLSGAWLGHALHPLLTDIPIGVWTSSVDGVTATSRSDCQPDVGLAAPRRCAQMSPTVIECEAPPRTGASTSSSARTSAASRRGPSVDCVPARRRLHSKARQRPGDPGPGVLNTERDPGVPRSVLCSLHGITDRRT